MGSATVLTYSLNGGEISRRMAGRTDLDGIYDRATAKMVNFLATVEGPAMKRPGFRYISPAGNDAAWFRKFQFNVTQSYVLIFGEGKIRFVTNGGLILSGGSPYEVAVPYTAAEAPRLSIKQSYDRLYIAHPNHPPATLTRTGAETFEYEQLELKGGPFKDWNDNKAVTVSWSGAGEIGGLATITAGASIFDADHVGAPFIFEVEGFSDIPAWEANSRSDDLTTADYRRSDGKVYQFVEKPAQSKYCGNIMPTHTSGAEWDGSTDLFAETTDNRTGVKWQYRYDRFGVGTITSVGDGGTTAVIKVTRTLPTLAAATWKWALPAFSLADGYPQLVDIWGQRLIFWKDVDIAGSVVAAYRDFSPIDEHGVYAPDQGFRLTSEAADPPLWSHADKQAMLCGSATQEIVVEQLNRAAGISASNLKSAPQSNYGSTECWPVTVGDSIIWAQRGGRKIREAQYRYEGERFAGLNLTVYARHIARSGLTWLAFQQEPEEMLWGGRADGVLVAHPHSPEQAVKGFSRCQLADGTVISGVTIPSEDGSKDELWVLADLDGHRCILSLADYWDEDPDLDADGLRDQLEAAFYVDYGVSYSGAATDTFTTGLNHLEGRAVVALADGKVVRDLTVTGGAVTLPFAAATVHIGLAFTAEIELLAPEPRGMQSAQGLRKRAVRLLMRLIDSCAPWLTDRRDEGEFILRRDNSLAMGDPPPLFTGDTDAKSVGAGSERDGALPRISSDDPLPLIVAMIRTKIEIEEGV